MERRKEGRKARTTGLCCISLLACTGTCPVGNGINGASGSACSLTADRVCGACLAGSTFNNASLLSCTGPELAGRSEKQKQRISFRERYDIFTVRKQRRFL